jgi:hypothetical protein
VCSGRTAVVIRNAFCPPALTSLLPLPGYFDVTRICTSSVRPASVRQRTLVTSNGSSAEIGGAWGAAEIVAGYVRWRTVGLATEVNNVFVTGVPIGPARLPTWKASNVDTRGK